jgi:phytoene dehydrogenase-like protein
MWAGTKTFARTREDFMTQTKPVAIIGGGLAGLTAAVWLARAGTPVTVFEKARHVGGRAMTETRSGFQFNLGPHALYAKGAAARIFGELEIEFSGRVPALSGGYALDGGTKQTLPMGFASMLTTGLLNLPAKLEAAKLFSTIGKLNAQVLQGMSVRTWLDESFQQPQTRRLAEAYLRLSTYANDAEQLSAGAAISQLQLALAGGVLYLDGGWQTLVDKLRLAAEQAGGNFVTGARVTQIEHNGAVQAIRLADGQRLPVMAAILATSPAEAGALLHDGAQHNWAWTPVPVKVACLDVALQRLPEPHALFALGIDRPLYFSVHSATARLAPAEGVLIHVAKYLGNETADVHAVERELEGVLDLLQPGWRTVLAEHRFLSSMTAANALVTAAQGGYAGRPKPDGAGICGLFLAGDWVGNEGMLADASVASGKRAAELILQQHALAALAA